MAAERQADTFTQYIVARLALWAGDFDYFQQLVGDVAPRSEFGKIPDSMNGPEEVVRYCAALRSRQLSQKRGELSKRVEALASDRVHVDSQPTVLQTTHLRGAVWRRGPRRFILRAFLNDLAWESELYLNAARLQSKYRGIELGPPNARLRVPTRTWLIPGRFIIEVVMGSLGLLEADGLWSDNEQECTIRDVVGAFDQLLIELDPGSSPRHQRPTGG